MNPIESVKRWWKYLNTSPKDKVLYYYPNAKLVPFHMYLIFIDDILVGAGMTEKQAWARAWKNLRLPDGYVGK